MNPFDVDEWDAYRATMSMRYASAFFNIKRKEIMAAWNQEEINEKYKIRILRRKQVEDRTGLSRSTIYSKLTQNPKRPGDYDPTFPKPISVGAKAVGWIESELDAWLIAQVEKSRKVLAV